MRLRRVWQASSGELSPRLPALIHAAAASAYDAVRGAARTVVRYGLAQAAEGRNGTSASASSLCKELYVALKLYGGRLGISRNDVTREAIRYGILALNPTSRLRTVNLLVEPCIAGALEAEGDELVRGSLDTDPVYQRLTAHLRDHAPLFSHIDTVNGLALEAVFVWHVLRTVILQGGQATSAVLCGFLSERGPLPDHVMSATVTAKRACTPVALAAIAGPTTTEGQSSCPDFAVFTQPGHDVLFGVDPYAGADVVCSVTRGNGSNGRDLVLVQAKAGKASRLADCLGASTPAWQYIEGPQRRAIMGPSGVTGMTTAPSAKRAAFSRLAAAHPALFEHPIRVVFTVGGFADRTLQKCRELNDGPCSGSPVVLCSLSRASDAMLPAQLRDGLVEACRKDGQLKQAVHPEDERWWLPHSIEGVDAAIRESRSLASLPV